MLLSVVHTILGAVECLSENLYDCCYYSNAPFFYSLCYLGLGFLLAVYFYNLIKGHLSILLRFTLSCVHFGFAGTDAIIAFKVLLWSYQLSHRHVCWQTMASFSFSRVFLCGVTAAL